jgi:hypothetical protein
MPFGIEGVIIWFRLIKLVCNLELKIFGHCFVVFELEKYFVVLHLTHPKPLKLLKLVLKWPNYVLSKWRGSLFGLGNKNQFEFWSSSSFLEYWYKTKCIYDIICIIVFFKKPNIYISTNQSVKIIHFEGWKNN